jgi:thiol:disulfide interchange protein
MIAVSLVCVGAVVFAQLNKKSQQKAPGLTKDAVAAKPTSARSSANTGGSIAWETDLTSALDQAKSEDKIVIVDVYTDWCGWCKRMDQVIYNTPRLSI